MNRIDVCVLARFKQPTKSTTSRFWFLFVSRWVQEAEWAMDDAPVIDPIEYLGVVGPKNMAFSKVTPRKS